MDVKALLDLLAPTGKLYREMLRADADELIQYVFPVERLPTHTQVGTVGQHFTFTRCARDATPRQMLLSLPAGRTHLGKWPQYAGRIVVDASGRCQLHLNVLCYFLFWLAFAVLKGGDSAAASDKRRTVFDPAGITQFARKVGVCMRWPS